MLVFTIFPFFLMGKNDTVILLGPNGKINPSGAEVLKKEIKYRSKKKVRIRTYKSDADTWQRLFVERIKIQDSVTYLIYVKGDQFSDLITRRFETLPNGTLQFTDFQNGTIRRTGQTLKKIPLLFHGQVTEYYPDGQKKSEADYKNNELISNRNWTVDGKEYIHHVFYSVEREPRYLRGTHLLHDHILKTFNESKVDMSEMEGKIVVGFVVMENGTIDGIRIDQGLNQVMNQLALKAFRTLAGEWQPALLNGENVRYYQLFPIQFIYHKFEFDYLEMRGSMLYWDIN